MRIISALSFVLIFLTSSILRGQMNSIPDYSNDNKNRKKIGLSTCIEAFGAKNTATLLGYNLKMNYSNHERIFWSVFFKRGHDFSDFGAVEPMSKRENLLKYLNEGGFLFGYRIADTQTGPYLRRGSLI